MLVNTLAADEKDPLLNRDNYLRNKKIFSELFVPFLIGTINFHYFEKKIWLSLILYFQNYGLQKPDHINV